MTTTRPPLMGISIYRGDVLLGRALEAEMEGNPLEIKTARGPVHLEEPPLPQVTLKLGTIDRFEVLRYLTARVPRDLMGEVSIAAMPPLTVYFEASAFESSIKFTTTPTKGKGKKKEAPPQERVKLTLQPSTIEVNINTPGQSFSFQSLRGQVVGDVVIGAELPIPKDGAPTPSDDSPLAFY